MKKTHDILAAIAALLPMVAAATEPAAPPKVSVTLEWAGIYSADLVSKTPDPRELKGFRSSVSNLQYLRQGTQLEAVPGLRFGIRYQFTGLPKMMQVRHHTVIRFPEGGLTNPQTGRHALFDRTERWCEVDKPCLSGRQFSEPWELIPGTWAFEVWRGDKMVLSQAFEVTIAPAAPTR